ncbi:hypothetical protein F2Q69_00023672 [Brassica cretica]|uniref:Transmembrane protein n=1 Tax=Brassica cretica TaxID=69181 RepID=A0A8S9QE75_BRACR|nr:hypothetical protein F2Q69_00023672 [Brassica cretica]
MSSIEWLRVGGIVIWRGSWWLWVVSGLPPPSVAPHGVVALPSVGGCSLEHHSSVIRLTLLAGLGALSSLGLLSSQTRFFVSLLWWGLSRLLVAVWRLLYRPLQRLQRLQQRREWDASAPNRINVKEVVMTKGPGVAPTTWLYSPNS